MFQNLRAGSPIYVFYKSQPSYAVGEVLRVENPTDQFGNKVFENLMLQQKTAFVDVVARVGGNEQKFGHIGAGFSISDSGVNGVIISDNLSEFVDAIAAFSSVKEAAVADYDKNVADLEACKSILCELDPRRKKEKEQADEINTLRSELTEIRALLSEMAERSHKTKEN